MVGSKAVSNADFARRVGVHFTMASRLRNGHRVPSPYTLIKIREAFGLTPLEVDEMLQSCETDQQFGTWAREHLFEDPIDLALAK
jgi:transcriptional regulator with XRE-family HTH domain